MSVEAVIQGRNVGKVFKDFWGRPKVSALSDVSFSVPKGCVFGLLGPNGAGKSTLIKLILGHLFPSTGKLSVLGAPPREVSHKAKMGYLPERSYLYKHLTAAETLRYFGRLLELTEDQIDSRSEQLLDMVGLGSAKDRRAGEFSHGMGRRLGLAQALLNDPDLLILDEPTAGLDPVGCREVKNLIQTLGRRGKTILLTSHLLADVEDTCQEVMMLYGGKIQSAGTMDAVLENTARTVLEFPNVGADTLSAARALLEKDAGAGCVEMRSPRQSLEDYFLAIVARSNQGSQYTGGAHMGKGVADYLSDGGAAAAADASSAGGNLAPTAADLDKDGRNLDSTVMMRPPKPMKPARKPAETKEPTAPTPEPASVEAPKSDPKPAPAAKAAEPAKPAAAPKATPEGGDDGVDRDVINKLLG